MAYKEKISVAISCQGPLDEQWLGNLGVFLLSICGASLSTVADVCVYSQPVLLHFLYANDALVEVR